MLGSGCLTVRNPYDAVEKVIGAGSLQISRKNDAIRSPISDRRWSPRDFGSLCSAIQDP
jgi:hypothetical protein